MARMGRPCWAVAVRGKKNLPMWAPFRRADVWDDPWFGRDFFRPMGPRRVNEQLRDAVQHMNRLMCMSPWRVFEESPFRAAEHGVNAEIMQVSTVASLDTFAFFLFVLFVLVLLLLVWFGGIVFLFVVVGGGATFVCVIIMCWNLLEPANKYVINGYFINRHMSKC